MTTTVDARVQELLDKQAITDLLTRYMRAVDRGDVATVRGCYLPGATEDHGGLFDGRRTGLRRRDRARGLPTPARSRRT